MADRRQAVSVNNSLLSQLTPTEIALLFPDYFKRGTPDIGGFRAAISRQTAEKNAAWQQAIGERVGMDASTGQPYAGGQAGYGKVSNPVKAKEIYDYLRQKGVDHNHAVGMINNINHESNMDSGAFNRNDVNGPSGGLFQHHSKFSEGSGGRFNNMVRYVGDDWRTNWKKQIDFALQEDETKKYLATNYGDASAASVGFTHLFEKPANTSTVAYDRLKTLGTMEKLTKESGPGGAQQTNQERAAQGATPLSGGGNGQSAGGMSFDVKSGFIVPKDNNLYDPRNVKQCATLGKAFNPAIGKSSGWTIVDGDIKAGQVVATKQYNNGGNDREGAGYHTGVALTAPNEKGDFLLLEQHNRSNGAKTRWVNKNSYPIGDTGQSTSWGLISSNGKVHDEISQEALQYGHGLATPEQKKSIGSNSGAPGAGGEAAPGVSGEVYQGGDYGGGPIDGQTASLMQPMGMMPNLMGSPMTMMMGLMGGINGLQSATPLGLVTTAMGFIMPLIGSFMGERISGEGMGDGPRRMPRIHVRGGTRRHLGVTPRQTASSSKPAEPVDTTPIVHRSSLGELSRQYESGKRGVHTVSTGRKDPGGISYGEHQLATKTGTMAKYVSSKEAQPYAHNFAGLTPGTPQFNKVYKQIAQNDPTGFAKSQHSFITRTHYEPVYRHAKKLGYNVDDPRVQEALFSMSVQHGKANRIVTMAKGAAGGTPEQQIAALYDARHQYTMKNRQNFSKRYGAEKQDILAMDVGRYNRDYPTTQVASAQATTPTVGPGVPTPPTGPAATTAQAAREVTLGERLAKLAPIGSQGAAAAASPLATTPGVRATPATASTTAPMPSLNAFGEGKNMSATVMPGSSVQATTLPPIKGTAGAMPAPGPAPDMSAAQMGAMRNEMAAIAQQQSTPVMARQASMQAPPTQGFNPDHAMKQIAQPMNTPSFQRAMFNVNGESTPGEVGQNHFSYGNAR
jgi:hypothetical protein